MWKLRHADIDITSLLAGAALSCSVVTQRLFTRQSEICSEILCWTILPILLLKSRELRNVDFKIPLTLSDTQPLSSRTLWLTAASLTAVSVYRAETGLVELQPVLTPLLLVVQRRLHSEPSSPDTSGSRPPFPRVWGAILCAFIAVLSLSQGDFQGLALSFLAVVPQVFVYAAFLPKDGSISRQLPLVDSTDDDVERLCWRTMTGLTVAFVLQTSVFGLTRFQFTSVLLLGVIKAMAWFFIFQMRRQSSWRAVPAIETFSLIAAIDPFSQSSENFAIFDVIASGIALGQVIYMLPKQAKGKMYLWAFLLASLVPYLANRRAITESQSWTQQSFGGSQKHPVEILVDNAKSRFESVLLHQSKTYETTCDEYRRRYVVDPPNGFEDWYKFAVSHQSPIIDDFDTIHKSVSPFWKLSGTQFMQIMTDAQISSDGDLWSCTFFGAEARTDCSHPGRSFDRHIGLLFNKFPPNVSIALPDVKFLVNHLDEPRVLIPSHSSKDFDTLPDDSTKSTNTPKRTVWDALTRYCASERRDTSLVNSAMETFSMTFVTNSSSAMDLCEHPEYEAMHGLLSHPTSSRLMKGFVPILSTGSLSTMGDILYPSPAYIENEFQYNEANDVAWEKKQDNLYWAGSTTGGHASNDYWRDYHRQRFVSLAQNLEAKRHIYLRETQGVVTRVASVFLNSRLFDVAFTRIFQCDTRDCRDQKAYFRTKPWAEMYKAFRSKLAFDLDGNGISGRYYQLLASKSVPLKQTLLREWHDDRLIPWVHYVPISQSMEELPEVVSYLTFNNAGQQKAKKIAELGREWHSKALREIDMTIYIYRLLLEIARLQDPMRPAS